jgi:hypothetical protein
MKHGLHDRPMYGHNSVVQHNLLGWTHLGFSLPLFVQTSKPILYTVFNGKYQETYLIITSLYELTISINY